MWKLVFVSAFTALFSLPASAQMPFWWFNPPERDRRPYLEPYDRYAPPYGRERRSYRPPYEDPQYDRPLRAEPAREVLPLQTHIAGKVIIVFVNPQLYVAFDNGVQLVLDGIKMQGPVSTGALGYKTPLTKFEEGPASIEERHALYVSKTYPLDEWGRPGGGAEMPYAMFWDRKGGYALHAGTIPRWNGETYGHSKGCVRLPRKHARLLFEKFSGPDVRVIIAKDVLALYDWEASLAQAYASK